MHGDDFIFTINSLKTDTQKPNDSLHVVVMRHSLWWHTEEPSSWHSQTIPPVEQTSGSASLWCYGTWWLLPQDLHMDNKVLDMVWQATPTWQDGMCWFVPVASVGVNSWYQFCMMDTSASTPTSVAQVTSQRTISRRRQLRDDNVIRITWRNQKEYWKTGQFRRISTSKCFFHTLLPSNYKQKK